MKFVTPEIAALLKERNFDEPCFALYNPRLIAVSQHWGSTPTGICKRLGVYLKDEEILAPTYQDVIDWFREKHGLVLDVFQEADERDEQNAFYTGRWDTDISYLKRYKAQEEKPIPISLCFDDYYEAWDYLIKAAIKLI